MRIESPARRPAAAAAAAALASVGLALELADGPARTTLAVTGQAVAVLGALGLLAVGALMIVPRRQSRGAHRRQFVSILPRRGGRPGRLRLPRRVLAVASRAGGPVRPSAS